MVGYLGRPWLPHGLKQQLRNDGELTHTEPAAHHPPPKRAASPSLRHASSAARQCAGQSLDRVLNKRV